MKLFVFMLLSVSSFQLGFVRSHSNSSVTSNFTKFYTNPKEVLRVSSKLNEPFFYQSENGHFFNGIEYKLIKTIAEKEKLKLLIQSQPNSLKSYQIEADKLRFIDIFVSGLFPHPKFLDSFAVSKSYYQDDLIWCVQKATNVHHLLNIFLAATPEVWTIVIFGIGYITGFLLYIMIQFDLKYEKRNHRDWHYTTWLIALPTVIGISQRFQPKSGVLRVFYCFMLITNIFVWQIILFIGIKFIKMPVQKHQISTTSELIDWEYRLSGSTEVLGLLSFDDRYKKSQIDSFFVCPSIDQCLDHLKHDDNDNLAVGGSRQRILNSRSYSPSKIFCFDREESIVTYQPALFVRKNFVLKQRIDEIIRNAFEGGLFVKWDRSSQRNKERIVPYIPPPEYTLKEFSPAFVFILGIGSLMATSTLLCEIVINRKMMQPSRLRIWKYLEQFFDGKRHYFKDLPKKLMKGKNTL